MGNKLVPMPGLEVNYYRGYVIKWSERSQAYRVYDKKYPLITCFYCGSIMAAREMIDEL